MLAARYHIYHAALLLFGQPSACRDRLHVLYSKEEVGQGQAEPVNDAGRCFTPIVDGGIGMVSSL